MLEKKMDLMDMLKNESKIIVFNIVEESRWGGPQTRIYSLSKELSKSQIIPVAIFPIKGSEKISYLFNKSDLNYFSIKLTPIKSKINLLLKYLFYFIPDLLSIKRIFCKYRPHIVQCNGASQIKGLIVARILKIPVIWFLNDTRTPMVIKLIFQFLIRISHPYIIANSHRVKKYYLSNLKNYKRKVYVIQSPVDIDFFSSNEKIQSNDTTDVDIIKVVTVANINPDKGIEYFIKMISIINDQFKNVQFFIAGSHLKSQEGYSNNLKALIKNLNINNITFMGHVDDIKSFLASGNIYVCSSISEASPISVWEAMASGLPVVSTNVGDVKFFLKKENYNFIAPIKNSNELAKKTIKLLVNKNLRKNYGEFCKTVAARHMGLKTCVAKHKNIYNKIIKENYNYGDIRH